VRVGVRFLTVALAAVVSACTETLPARPAKVFSRSFTLSDTSLTLGRNATRQLAATTELTDGSLKDVTADAAWTTTAPDVAIVNGGLVTAVGIGEATVSASFGGRVRTVSITAHRNLRVEGKVTVRDVPPPIGTIGRIDVVTLDVEGRGVGGLGCGGSTSGRHVCTVSFPSNDRTRSAAAVEPGSREVGVEVHTWNGSPVALFTDPESTYRLVDRDTNEVVETGELPRLDAAAGPQRVTMRWTVQIPRLTR
jgi:hypothetical protein